MRENDRTLIKFWLQELFRIEFKVFYQKVSWIVSFLIQFCINNKWWTNMEMLIRTSKSLLQFKNQSNKNLYRLLNQNLQPQYPYKTSANLCLQAKNLFKNQILQKLFLNKNLQRIITIILLNILSNSPSRYLYKSQLFSQNL